MSDEMSDEMSEAITHNADFPVMNDDSRQAISMAQMRAPSEI